jgi:hypothetical protein
LTAAGDTPGSGVLILEDKRESDGGLAEAAPHYYGHRERLRGRFRDAGAEALSEYELLELLLFRALPRRDVKPLAKTLLAKFGSFAEVIAAPQARLAEVKRLGGAGITELKIVQAAASRLLRGAITKRPVLWSSVLDYCRTAQGFAEIASSSAYCFSTSAINSSPTKCSRPAPSITPRSIHARWSSARSNYRRARSSWCTIIPPATRRRHRRTSK